MNTARNISLSRILGVIFVMSAVIVNQWFLAWVFSSDGEIESRLFRGLIWTFQGIALAVGVAFFSGGSTGCLCPDWFVARKRTHA